MLRGLSASILVGAAHKSERCDGGAKSSCEFRAHNEDMSGIDRLARCSSNDVRHSGYVCFDPVLAKMNGDMFGKEEAETMAGRKVARDVDRKMDRLNSHGLVLCVRLLRMHEELIP